MCMCGVCTCLCVCVHVRVCACVCVRVCVHVEETTTSTIFPIVCQMVGARQREKTIHDFDSYQLELSAFDKQSEN